MGGRAMAEMRRETITIETRSGPVALSVEIADTPPLQARGLMFRRQLGDNEGMLFLYEPPQEIAMWMLNTYLSLDMVFIRADGRVHRIVEATEPFSTETIPSKGPVAAVLEIRAGRARALGIRPGDQVVHRHFKSG